MRQDSEGVKLLRDAVLHTASPSSCRAALTRHAGAAAGIGGRAGVAAVPVGCAVAHALCVAASEHVVGRRPAALPPHESGARGGRRRAHSLCVGTARTAARLHSAAPRNSVRLAQSPRCDGLTSAIARVAPCLCLRLRCADMLCERVLRRDAARRVQWHRRCQWRTR